MYKHILVAVVIDKEGAADRSVEAAQSLADEGAKVTVLHVREAVPGYAMQYIPKEHAANIAKTVQEELDKIAAQFSSGTGVLVEGHSGRTIVDWAESHGVDCIVLASHQPGVQDYLLGSTAGRVVRHAHCSVHVVR